MKDTGLHDQLQPDTPDQAMILSAIPVPVIVLDAQDRFCFANLAAEIFLGISITQLRHIRLADLLPHDSRIFALLAQVRAGAVTVSDHDLAMESPRINHPSVSVQAAPLGTDDGGVLLVLQDASAIRTLDRQMGFRSAVRSVTGMAAMLAHEIKNPLSGIRGAAQLLEQNASPADRDLTQLICDETDRIHKMVDQMEAFGDTPAASCPVNIHHVLEHVRLLAQAGFARHVRFHERYDPSLPPVPGNADQLIQVVLNLVKNAAEALPEQGGEIVLGTSYQQGLRLTVPNGKEHAHLPLLVSIRDNGPGISSDILPHLFDPFVSSKPGGQGLGLSLVAKIVHDHGGVIDVASRAGRTEFRISLPVLPDEESTA